MEYKLDNKILQLENVSIGYGKELILKDINLEEFNIITSDRNTGQTIAIVGPSGRGKSTLFKALTGLIKPSTGQIIISDNYGLKTAKNVSEGDIGFVDQKYNLFRHKTVEQTLFYALRNKTQKDFGSITQRQFIANYLVDWNLLPHKDKYPCELSGGQRQRTAILEQLLTSKQFIIFDEPASGLDVLNIEKLKQAFDNIMQQDDLNTIIFSTHDINLAVELADSIYIIGHKEPTDTVSTIVAHYDLKQLGLAWSEFGINHLKLADEIKNIIKQV